MAIAMGFEVGECEGEELHFGESGREREGESGRERERGREGERERGSGSGGVWEWWGVGGNRSRAGFLTPNP
ncbi:MAG: hypothetical protein OHK0037_05690 [Elainellaceae cyanobacterium]